MDFRFDGYRTRQKSPSFQRLRLDLGVSIFASNQKLSGVLAGWFVHWNFVYELGLF
jgi:hypothetical protein